MKKKPLNCELLCIDVFQPPFNEVGFPANTPQVFTQHMLVLLLQEKHLKTYYKQWNYVKMIGLQVLHC